MIRHLFRLVWNRRRTNFFLGLEIFFSFLVLFAVAALGVYSWDALQRPLGYRWDGVWAIGIDPKERSNEQGGAERGVPPADGKPAPVDPEIVARAETLRQLVREVAAMPPVEAVAMSLAIPYDLGSWTSSVEIDGRHVDYERSDVTDDFARVMDLTLTKGRFFSPEDDGAASPVVVINQNLAAARFGSENPIGKSLSDPSEQKQVRVVGVVSDFRKRGELSPPGNFVFFRASEGDFAKRGPRRLMVRLRPGTPRGFEESLAKTLAGVAPSWSFKVMPLEERRRSMLKLQAAPFVVAGLVAAFLLGMVALGLTGVLWQSVTQRTREIGLRRAKGATARRISRQIVGEIWILTLLAVVPGLALALQVPLLSLMPWVPGNVWGLAAVSSAGLLFLLTTLCGLYPSWLAMRVSPVEALHYE